MLAFASWNSCFLTGDSINPRYLAFFFIGIPIKSERPSRHVEPANTTDLFLFNLRPNYFSFFIPAISLLATSKQTVLMRQSSAKATKILAIIAAFSSGIWVKQ